nr:hypothetical protein [Fusobacterium gastrosuis]
MQELVKEKELFFLDEIFENNKLEVSEKFNDISILNDLSNITLYYIEEITFDAEDKIPRREAFENVIGTIQEEGVNFLYLINGTKKGVSFYFGLVKESDFNGSLSMPIQEMGEKLLSSAIKGNFRGSKIREVEIKEMEKLLMSLNRDSLRCANLIGVPGINEADDRSNFQGVDRLVDVMAGDEFTLCIVAKPLQKKAIKDIENSLYEIYNSLTLYSKVSLQESKNESEGKTTTTGENKSTTDGKSETTGENENKSVSTTKGENKSISITKGSSTSTSKGKNESIAKTTGDSTTETKGNSSSSGESSSKTSSSSGSMAETIGKNYSETESISKSDTNSEGINESETHSLSKGTNKTIGVNSSETIGESSSIAETKTEGKSINKGWEISNKKANDYIKYLDEILFPIIDYGKSKGLYLTTTFIFTPNRAGLIKLGNTMKSLYSGKKGNKNPLELEILEEDDKRIEYFKNFQIPNCNLIGNENSLTLKSHYIEDRDTIPLANWYSTNELSILANLPEKEVVGLALKEEIEFGLNYKNVSNTEQILLGNLVRSGNILNEIEVSIEKAALNKHIFISGVTGSGKTTTCQKLLLESGMPFLVIEPAKTEYRILVNEEKTKDILVFTLGKDNVAPFRLNPFEFFEHESITSRVDMLKATMEAAFDMEAAIPQIIESSIYACYKDYGWNIDTNINEKYKNPFDEGVYSFPTLEDLLKKVDTEVEKHGFDERLKKDYIGSIKARLQSLLMGAKGQMLNTHRGIDFRDLLEKQVVLEIEEIKNGDEKALLIGFILTNLCEALKAKFKKDRNFKHITLIEEAHRLLSRIGPGDSLNKKRSVETFADMLAEVRKYGESLIIVDQIPNKMTPEVLKNTNTKIVHKIFAEDDKEAIGNTIALTKEQKNFLSSLSTGRAIVFSQGWEKALQVQIKPTTNTSGDDYIEDDILRERVEKFYMQKWRNNIFLGTKYREVNLEEFRRCRNLSSNSKINKIFLNSSEKYININTFEDFENLMNLLHDEYFWKNIEKILEDKENEIENIDEFKEYYLKKELPQNIGDIIFERYYDISLKNKRNICDIIREIENRIKEIFKFKEINLEYSSGIEKKEMLVKSNLIQYKL